MAAQAELQVWASRLNGNWNYIFSTNAAQAMDQACRNQPAGIWIGVSEPRNEYTPEDNRFYFNGQPTYVTYANCLLPSEIPNASVQAFVMPKMKGGRALLDHTLTH